MSDLEDSLSCVIEFSVSLSLDATDAFNSLLLSSRVAIAVKLLVVTSKSALH